MNVSPLLSLSSDTDHEPQTEPEANTSILTSVINCVKMMLGAGVLALPFAFSQTGVILGLVLVALFGIIQGYVVYLLALCIKEMRKESFPSRLPQKDLYSLLANEEDDEILPVEKPKPNNRFICFQDMAVWCFSQIPYISKQSWIVEFSIGTASFGFACTYLVILGDLMPQIVNGLSSNPPAILTNRHFWISIIGSCVGLPLMFPRKLSALKVSSFLGNMGFLLLLIIILLLAIGAVDAGDVNSCASSPPNSSYSWEFNGNILQGLEALSVLVFTFSIIQIIPQTVQELHDNTTKRLVMVISSSMTSVMIFSSILGFGGYVAYGSDVCSDLIKSFPNTTLFTISRFAMIICVLGSFPLLMHPARESLCQLCLGCDSARITRTQYIAATGLVFISAWAVAFSVSDMSFIIGFVGATSGILMGYTFPALFYVVVFSNGPWDLKRISAAIICGGSLALIPILVASKALNMASGN